MEHTEIFHTSHHDGLNVGRGKLLRYTRIHVCTIVIHIKYSFSDIHTYEINSWTNHV
jgi:hypothetical protein